MKMKPRVSHRSLAVRAVQVATFFALSFSLFGQSDRIIGRIAPERTVTLRGNRNSKALPQYDRGPVEPSLRLGAITILLNRTAAQQAAIERLLEEQQDSRSPNYHNWLTPEQYADRFGASQNDIDKISAWLQSAGLTVEHSARGRDWIMFSGTAVQVQAAFQAEIHQFLVDGEMRYANAGDPSIPAAIAPIVSLIRGLDNIRLRQPKLKSRPAGGTPGKPLFRNSDGSHYLMPGDLTKIYNVDPLYHMGLSGAGQKIAILGTSDVNLADIQAFRTAAGLPQNDPQKILVPGSVDPGITGDALEGYLDLEWAGAMAPSATLLFVYTTSLEDAFRYAVDQNIAPIISMSFSGCVQPESAAAQYAAGYRAIAQVAATQGMTWLVSSGDSGAAGCDVVGAPVAILGLEVNIFASAPEVTGVGGTEFNEGSGQYWDSKNSATGGSALSYIPEKAWNGTATPGGLLSGGGGVSAYFPKPDWQTGPGVPNDSARDVPDVALISAGPYYIVMDGQNRFVGGTSAAAPVFAGMVALLNQYAASTGKPAQPGLGNINPALYHLAQTATGVFHDVTLGNNIVPCQVGTKDCSSGQIGYEAHPGYDLVTGLGSVDAYNLIMQWNGTTASPTTTSLTADPASIAVTETTVLTATVTAGGGSVSGQVSFFLGNTTLGAATLSGSGSGPATASLTVIGSQLAAGNNTITAFYGGSSGFNGSSASINVSIPTAGSSAVIPSVVPAPVYQQEPDADGYGWFYTIRLAEAAGVGTTLTGFSIDGTDYTSSIQAFFGSSTLEAHGTLSVSLKSKLSTVPWNSQFIFAGVDAGGQKWTQQLSVPFLSRQIAASMTLSSAPGTVVQNPSGNPGCSPGSLYFQNLNLQEQNGYEVQLTRFLAGGTDHTSNIPELFGSWRLAPLGALQASLCWNMAGTPATQAYEIDGVDTEGNTISATASVPFQLPSQAGGTLSTSSQPVSLAASPGQSATATVAVNLPTDQQWTASLFPANQKTSWLTVYPLSGTGPSQINLVASAAGLANGAYTATLVLQSVNTAPQFVNVPIAFTIGASSGVSIAAVTNGASFKQSFGPGMILSVFGQNLAKSTLSAPSTPLPLTLEGVSATINGVPAPLYYVSPTQLNIQVPYETPARSAVLAVNNNGQVATFRFNVSATGTGIFAYANSLVPTPSAGPGHSVEFFITGEGDVTPFVNTGSVPSGIAVTQPPQPRLPLTMTVGGVPVTPVFVGVPSWSVGVTQINFVLPAGIPPGPQPVVVTVGGVASAPVNLTVQSASANVQPAVRSGPETVGAAHSRLLDFLTRAGVVPVQIESRGQVRAK
jgi:uncharacterized protein (TIGR03437 family)